PLLLVAISDRGMATIVAVIGHGREAPAADQPAALPLRPRRWTRLRRGRVGHRLHALNQPAVTQVTQTVGDRVGLDVRRHFVHAALVREGVLQACWGPQRSGEKGRGYG